MRQLYDDGEGSAYPPMLSTNCVQSVVTINPTLHHPKSSATSLPSADLNKIRHNQFRNIATSQCSTSVAAHCFSSAGGNVETRYNTTTLVATCNGGANGRIHLATIFEKHGGSDSRDGISRVIRMKYSSTKDDGSSNSPSFTTVCIASVPSRTSSAILALDTDGKLYANHFEVEESTERQT